MSSKEDEKIGNPADWQYLRLLDEIMRNGVDRAGRNGTTRTVFSRTFRHDLRKGFPVITTKQLFFRVAIAELLWFIEGGKRTNYRLDNNRLRELLGYPKDRETIWSLNAEHTPSWAEVKAKFLGDCGRIYGAQWRNWTRLNVEVGSDRDVRVVNNPIDQLANAIETLRSDPFNRRNIVTSWNPTELDDMCLPPCHRDFQFFVEEGDDGERLLSMEMHQRSCDVFLGVPFNIMSYALLLAMVAQVVGYTAKEIVIVFADTHIYHAHFDAVREQLGRTPYELPTLWLDPSVRDIDGFTMESIRIMNYKHHPRISATLL